MVARNLVKGFVMCNSVPNCVYGIDVTINYFSISTGWKGMVEIGDPNCIVACVGSE